MEYQNLQFDWFGFVAQFITVCILYLLLKYTYRQKNSFLSFTQHSQAMDAVKNGRYRDAYVLFTKAIEYSFKAEENYNMVEEMKAIEFHCLPNLTMKDISDVENEKKVSLRKTIETVEQKDNKKYFSSQIKDLRRALNGKE